MPSHRACLFRAPPHTPVARWSSMSTPCAPIDLIGTKRIVAGVTASQIASASAASLLLWRLTQTVAQADGISRTSCPSAPSSRASEARFAHASMPSRQIEAAGPRPTFP
jgi:hypothetical protein